MEKLTNNINYLTEEDIPTIVKAYDDACIVIDNLIADQNEILYDMWEECKTIPDDEIVEVKAKNLKNFIETTFAMSAYINQDMNKVKDYLERRQFI